MEPILTIGITSYKRVNELKRCLSSIKTKYVSDIEILVSEDHSPLSDEIKAMVEEFSSNSEYLIRFTTNTVNLGYDMNLGSIIQKSNGKYIFFLSDDDKIADGFLDVLIPFIKTYEGYGVIYSPFVHSNSLDVKERSHGKSHDIVKGESSASRYIYDSILFSGLIFSRQFVKNIDSAKFKNKNYFQVYLFLTMLYKYGGYYINKTGIVDVGDGENAYGISESSGGNELLANRKNVKSNLEFNKTLIQVVKMFDADNNTNVLDSFAKQYSLHSYSGLSIARESGLKFFDEYWRMLKDLPIKLYPVTKSYYHLLKLFGKEKSDKMLQIFMDAYRKKR